MIIEPQHLYGGAKTIPLIQGKKRGRLNAVDYSYSKQNRRVSLSLAIF